MKKRYRKAAMAAGMILIGIVLSPLLLPAFLAGMILDAVDEALTAIERKRDEKKN